jgi:hypothetical protein
MHGWLRYENSSYIRCDVQLVGRERHVHGCREPMVYWASFALSKGTYSAGGVHRSLLFGIGWHSQVPFLVGRKYGIP